MQNLLIFLPTTFLYKHSIVYQELDGEEKECHCKLSPRDLFPGVSQNPSCLHADKNREGVFIILGMELLEEFPSL